MERASAETMPLVTVCPTPNGIADGEHKIAHLQLVGIAEWQSGELLALGVDLQHGKIGARIGKDDLGFEFAPVGQRDPDVLAAFDDMVVGDDDAFGPHDHAGAEGLLDPARLGRRPKNWLKNGRRQTAALWRLRGRSE